MIETKSNHFLFLKLSSQSGPFSSLFCYSEFSLFSSSDAVTVAQRPEQPVVDQQTWVRFPPVTLFSSSRYALITISRSFSTKYGSVAQVAEYRQFFVSSGQSLDHPWWAEGLLVILHPKVAGSSPVAPTFPTNPTMGDRSIGRTPGFEPGNGGSNPFHPTTAGRCTSDKRQCCAPFPLTRT